jgi:hypothetical protein
MSRTYYLLVSRRLNVIIQYLVPFFFQLLFRINGLMIKNGSYIFCQKSSDGQCLLFLIWDQVCTLLLGDINHVIQWDVILPFIVSHDCWLSIAIFKLGSYSGDSHVSSESALKLQHILKDSNVLPTEASIDRWVCHFLSSWLLFIWCLGFCWVSIYCLCNPK